MPTDEFLPGAAAPLRKYGTSSWPTKSRPGWPHGVPRGRIDVEPDMVLLAKAVGGHVPVRCAADAQSIFDKIFNR